MPKYCWNRDSHTQQFEDMFLTSRTQVNVQWDNLTQSKRVRKSLINALQQTDAALAGQTASHSHLPGDWHMFI